MDGRVLEQEKTTDHEEQGNARPVDGILQQAEVPPRLSQPLGIHQNGDRGVEGDHQQDGQDPQSVQKDQPRGGAGEKIHGITSIMPVRLPSAFFKGG